MALCSSAVRESRKFTSPNCLKRFRNAFITMPRKPAHTRPNKLPVSRPFSSSKRNYGGKWLKKKTDIGRDNNRPKTRGISFGLVAGRGQQVEVISHGAQVDIAKHLALGNVTVVDFYADWCGPCKQLSPTLEQMARTDPEIALRKIDIVNWNTAVAKQHNIHSIPQVNVYNRGGRLVGTVVGVSIEEVKRYVAQAKTGG